MSMTTLHQIPNGIQKIIEHACIKADFTLMSNFAIEDITTIRHIIDVATKVEFAQKEILAALKHVYQAGIDARELFTLVLVLTKNEYWIRCKQLSRNDKASELSDVLLEFVAFKHISAAIDEYFNDNIAANQPEAHEVGI